MSKSISKSPFRPVDAKSLPGASFSPTRFRHTVAMVLLMYGPFRRDPVMTMLGHRQTDTTRKYAEAAKRVPTAKRLDKILTTRRPRGNGAD